MSKPVSLYTEKATAFLIAGTIVLGIGAIQVWRLLHPTAPLWTWIFSS